MLNLNLDQKYSSLIDSLTLLNAKLNKFINGNVSDLIQTDRGTIKSLAGTIRDLETFKYVQKIIDHRLYIDMTADTANIEVGMMVRVWGDTNLVNGIYKKNVGLTFDKIVYQDLYGLTNPTTPVRWFRDTTDATLTELFLDGIGQRSLILANSARSFKLLVVARDNINNVVASWELTGAIKRDGLNNTILVGSGVVVKVVVAKDIGATTWDVNVTADNINNALAINVVGAAGATIRWNVIGNIVDAQF